MSVSLKVKSLLLSCNKTHKELSDYFNISKQALSNKFHRDSLTAADLIKIADFCGVSLCFLSPDDNTRITFEIEDLTKK